MINKIKTEKTAVRYEPSTGSLSGGEIVTSVKYLRQLNGTFSDREAFEAMDPETVVYRVESHFPVSEGTEGGLFFGTSYIMPGRVGNEYFMTKGHYHRKADRAEYYWGISGEGMLLLWGPDGTCRAEKVEPGSLHYIPGMTAHRLVNTGNDLLAVGACWPSDAGHDYGSIEEKGFPVYVVCRRGKPEIIEK